MSEIRPVINVNFLKLIKIASWIWLVFGIMMLSVVLFMVFLPVYYKVTDNAGLVGLRLFDEDSTLMAITISISILVGYSLLRMGWLTLKGKAKDTLGKSLGSFFIAILISPLIVYSDSDTQVIFWLLVSLLLMSAAIFALIGRNDYKKWVSEKKNS